MVGSEQERMAALVRQRLEGLRGRDLTDAEVDVEVGHLLAAGKAAIPVILEQFTEEDETLLAVATQALKACQDSRPVEQLVGMLRNPEVGDLSKALILSVLEHYGLDVDDPEVFGLGIDLEEYRLDTMDGENGGVQGA